MNYTTLLFDADETLLDFSKTENEALLRTFAEFGIRYDEEVRAVYDEVNHGLWRAFENGEIKQQDVLNRRFQETFVKLGIVPPADFAFEKAFQLALGEGAFLIDGALELIQELSKEHDIYIVTNGVTATQHSRMNACGLKPYLKAIFVSEETGHRKPEKEYFDYVFAHIPGLEPEKTLLVGDSLNSDIKGGNIAGIDTCWYNPRSKENTTSALPTYEIHQLEELKALV